MIWLILITTVLMFYWVYLATEIDLYKGGLLIFVFRLIVTLYIEFFLLVWWFYNS